jgi:hypothetical protein
VARTLAAVFYEITTGIEALQPLPLPLLMLMLLMLMLMLLHLAWPVGDDLSSRARCCAAGIGASCRSRSCEAGDDSKYGHLSRVTCDVRRV